MVRLAGLRLRERYQDWDRGSAHRSEPGPHLGLRGHRSAWRMNVATATGLAMNAVCEPSMVSVVAPIRCAMNRSASGEIAVTGCSVPLNCHATTTCKGYRVGRGAASGLGQALGPPPPTRLPIANVHADRRTIMCKSNVLYSARSGRGLPSRLWLAMPRRPLDPVCCEEPDQRLRWWAACRASCGRVDGRLDVHHRRPVDCLQSVDFNPKPLARHDAGTVQADGVRPIGRTGAEHAG
jgi:hypothetical protein